MILKPLPILNKYVNQEILRTCVAILVVLILIFLSGRFVKFIQMAVDGTISSSAVFSLLGLKVPMVAGFLLPLSFFVAMLLTFGRLHVDNEMAILHGVGISELQLAKNIMPLALILAFISAGLSFWVTPWSGHLSKEILTQEKMDSRFGVFSAGAFRENKSKSGVVFVESIENNGQVNNLFAVSGLNEVKGQLEIQLAQSARFNYDESADIPNHLVLEHGLAYLFDQQTNRWQITEYDSYFMQIEQSDSEALNLKNQSIASSELLKKGGVGAWAELHWRLSAPLSIPILCLLAIPLARTQPRKGKFSRLFPAILVYMVYALLMMNCRQLIEKEKIPIELGFWWIHGLAIIFCFWLYKPSMKPSNSKLGYAHD